ncbi:flagellar hook-associated protein FlgL [Planococcus sp. PAMC 21323]|uniref:flagellar hook-associated protein FlgL n=1 Tax=Planococcus sp. PAMC 21323 TaxID=1526927 RepID=UPI0005703337|nr:flagellar hook-associated protein FlgL [Planococcus sp. PAMC 21323]AIY04085.1 flagellar hook-associated protein FlgL [Planococcus sp. PAMC 21323]
MRVTQQMLQQNSIRNMNQNLSRFEKMNNQVSTGKLLHRPSDDPNGVSKSMSLKSSLVANEQFERNTGAAKLWMEETDQNINATVNVMQRVRELGVQSNNDTLSDSDRNAIAAEIEQLTEQVREFANTKVNGNYLFNGQQTDQAPYPQSDSYLTTTFAVNPKTISIGDKVTIEVSVTPDKLFGNAGDSNNLFTTLNDMVNSLKSNGKVDLEKIDAGIERLLTVSAENGGRQNRVEAVENRLLDSNLELKSMLSKLQDVDYAEAIIKLKSEESVYQASLAATSKIIQPSLMDFLR